MEVASITPVDFSPALTQNESASGAGAEQAAAEFESVFVSLLLKEMRGTLSEGFFGSESSDVLGGMFDQYMGQHIAAGSQLGIKQMVQQHHLNQMQVSESNPLTSSPDPSTQPTHISELEG